MKKTFLCFVFFYLCAAPLQAQVTIGTNNPPDPSAVLDLQSNNKGLLLPQLTTLQRNAISIPHIGLQIYNTDNHCVETYFPTGWKPLGCDCSLPPPAPVSVSGPLHVCPGQNGVVFEVMPVPGATSYIWSVSNQDIISFGQGTDSIHVNFSNQHGNRTISVIASNACGNSFAYSITVNASNPDSTFTITPYPVMVNNASAFSANAVNVSYSWSFTSGNPALSSNQTQLVSWPNAGTYLCGLTVTDADGCTSHLDSNVVVTNCQPFTQSFTNCGQAGRTGPNQTQANATYGNGVVTVVNGVQQWVVPQSGNYTITAAGAEGGDKQDYLNNSGKGETVTTTLTLTAGDVLAIVVGQRGGQSLSSGSSGGGGGGGGSFVYNVNTNTLYVAAGGGGGIGAGNSTRKPGRNASLPQASGNNQQDNNNGTATYTYFAPTGNGGGSLGGVTGQSDYDSGGGAGWNSNGMNGVQYPGTEGGKTRVNGWLGGNFDNSRNPYVAVGGFGGGGGASDGGGGGGGYTGGNGGRWNSIASGGGGGTCYLINNANPVSQGLNSGHGYVTITKVCP